MSVVAHFFGGPQDGVLLERETAPSQIYFPERIEPTLPITNMAEVTNRDIVYQRRGPTLAGHAYYDWAQS